MCAAKGNSFENRDKKVKKRSSIVKMSELREETMQSLPNLPMEDSLPKENTVPKVENLSTPGKDLASEAVKETSITNEASIEKVLEPKVVTPQVEEQPIPTITKQSQVEDLTSNIPERVTIKATESQVPVKGDFFNLNVKNNTFEGKITTVRVYDDILDTLKQYSTYKNYPIIEFTNKVITVGLENLEDYGIMQISEIKMKNNTSRSIMYNLTDAMEEKFNKYIKEMSKKGYKVSRNLLLNVILNETLKKFYK